MVSILILTLNEEQNLPGCLRSVAWSDDVVVFDSFSTDRTPQVAQEMGARLVQRRFDNWAAHQNWAMENVTFKHDWVFYLDADERMTEELKQEILAIAADGAEKRVAFYCGRRNFFMGRWIRHAWPPSLIMRFFKPAHVRFERLVNPAPNIDGPHGYLKHQFLHYNFSKGLAEWFTKHNKYSQFEALEGMKVLRARSDDATRDISRLWARDEFERRRALKALSFRLPGRALLRFFYVYILKRGFLDGLPGFTYAILISMYEYWISLKILEQRSAWREQSDAAVTRLLSEQG